MNDHRNEMTNESEETMDRSHPRRGARPTAPRAVGALLGAAILGLAVSGCDLDRILRVEQAGQVDATDLENPVNARFLVSGTISDFDCAFGAYVVNQGMLGNELRDASVTAGRFSLDRRDFTPRDPYATFACNGNPPGLYTPVAVARATSDLALSRLEEWTDAEVANRTDLIAQAAAYSGYSHILLGEGFCTVVIEDLGPELQPTAAFEKAVVRFTRAMEAAVAANNAGIRDMAQLGRARARLNLASRGVDAAANYAGARDDAQAVLDRSPEFVKVSTASTASSRRYNRVGDEFFGGRITVDPSYRGLEVDGEPDPRVDVFDSGTVGHDSATPVWIAAKYGTARVADLRTASLPIATWREAHLIIAEADPDPDQTVARINVLRAHWDLPLYAGGTAQENAAQVIEERARELFLEGHHLSDLRRFNLPYVPAAGEPYRQGGAYGTNSCFPLPDVERENNPNL
jgi:starch-binding outer membrane protein, SusD/RagB family